MERLNSKQLKYLYSDFIRYRDVECNGMSDISITEFWRENKEKYENLPMNMCDGCARNLPIEIAGRDAVIKERQSDIRYYRKDRRDQMMQDQGLPVDDA